MDRIDHPSADTTTGRPLFAGGTAVTAEFLTAVQEEIVNVIVGAGLTPDPNDLTQLREAIRLTGRISLGGSGPGGTIAPGDLAPGLVDDISNSLSFTVAQAQQQLADGLAAVDAVRGSVEATRTAVDIAKAEALAAALDAQGAVLLADGARAAAEAARIEASSSNFTAFAARDAAVLARNEAEAFSLVTEQVRAEVSAEIVAATQTETLARVAADSALSSQITSLSSSVGAQLAAIDSTLLTKVDSTQAVAAVNQQIAAQGLAGLATISELAVASSRADGAVQATTVLTVEANGAVARRVMTAGPQGGLIAFEADRFAIREPGTTDDQAPFEVVGGQVRIKDAALGTARIGTLLLAGEAVTVDKLSPNAVSRPYSASGTTLSGSAFTIQMDRAGHILLLASRSLGDSSNADLSSASATFRVFVDAIERGAASYVRTVSFNSNGDYQGTVESGSRALIIMRVFGVSAGAKEVAFSTTIAGNLSGGTWNIAAIGVYA